MYATQRVWILGHLGVQLMRDRGTERRLRAVEVLPIYALEEGVPLQQKPGQSRFRCSSTP